MLKFWGRPSAYNVQKVHWLLQEMGIEYQHINIGGAKGGLDTDEFLNINPNGRVPVLEDNGNVIWESNSILRYLASQYAADLFWHECPFERSRYERWMDWELASFQPAFLGLFWGYYRTPENQRDTKAIAQFTQKCQQQIEILASHLTENKFVSGHQFGLADICVGTGFYRYFNMGAQLEAPKAVTQWYETLSERDAYKKVIQVSFSELKGRLTF